MKKKLSRIMAVMLAFTIVFAPGTIMAQDTYTLEEYGQLFTTTMDLLEQIGLDEEINYKDLFEAAMQGMLDSLDSYSEFMTIEEKDDFANALDPSFVGIGVMITQVGGANVVKEVIEGAPADDAGIQSGDIFSSVDGIDVKAYGLSDLSALIIGEANTEVSITIIRDEEELTFNIIRNTVIMPTVTQTDIGDIYEEASEALINQGAYVKISTFGTQTDEEFSKIVDELIEKGTAYLVLDLRDNPGGYVSTAVNICNEIIPAGDLVTFTDKNGDSEVYVSELEEAPFKIICLVNENSASSSELVASAIQDSGVGVLVGETTYGKGVSQYLYQLSDEYLVKVTAQEFTSRNGNTIQGIGITPDYYVDFPEYIVSERRLYLYDDFDEVLQVETILDYLGYDVGEPDTLYDSKTFDAVLKFQSNVALYPYGVCDHITQDYLNQAIYYAFLNNDIQLNKAIELVAEEIKNQ
jgi:carboxyl-terminal processing protease